MSLLFALAAADLCRAFEHDSAPVCKAMGISRTRLCRLARPVAAALRVRPREVGVVTALAALGGRDPRLALERLGGRDRGGRRARAGVVAQTFARTPRARVVVRGTRRRPARPPRRALLAVSVVPYGRMQFIDVTAGRSRRSFGLATVRLHTAGRGE